MSESEKKSAAEVSVPHTIQWVINLIAVDILSAQMQANQTQHCGTHTQKKLLKGEWKVSITKCQLIMRINDLLYAMTVDLILNQNWTQ